jgi:hypothetical protein
MNWNRDILNRKVISSIDYTMEINGNEIPIYINPATYEIEPHSVKLGKGDYLKAFIDYDGTFYVGGYAGEFDTMMHDNLINTVGLNRQQGVAAAVYKNNEVAILFRNDLSDIHLMEQVIEIMNKARALNPNWNFYILNNWATGDEPRIIK